MQNYKEVKTLKYLNLKGKRVLLRCDFNVPFSKEGEISDDFRINQALPTINYLLKKQAKVILISHLGRPKETKDKELIIKKYSLKPVAERMEKLLGKELLFLNDCIGKKIEEEAAKMKPGQIILLENLRFYKEEEEGDFGFAEKLAGLGDIYINDAFGVSHRPHASISGIPKFLPAAAGLLLEKEIKILSKVIEEPWRPLVAIIGGTKLETKINLIEQFLKRADHLLLGSKPAENILIAKNILIGAALPEGEELLEKIKRINLTDPKLHLPVDGQMALSKSKEKYSRIGAVGTLKREEEIFDIGPETIKIFIEIIKSAKMIVWNGPLGMFEKEPFERGTKEIAQALVRNYSAFKIIGGGDTVAAMSNLNLLDKFDHISTGGGAMLEFLSGKELPGIKALN